MATRAQIVRYHAPAVAIGSAGVVLAVIDADVIGYALAALLVLLSVALSLRALVCCRGTYGLALQNIVRSVDEGEKLTAPGPRDVHPADGLAFMYMIREVRRGQKPE